MADAIDRAVNRRHADAMHAALSELNAAAAALMLAHWDSARPDCAETRAIGRARLPDAWERLRLANVAARGALAGIAAEAEEWRAGAAMARRTAHG